MSKNRKNVVRTGDDVADAFKEDIVEEIKSAHDPGIESDEEIDGEVDAEGGKALKRRSN
ncbi:MAG: hypothetical protein ACLQPV_07525 [Vulcanimicrobiaceae bacterium]